MGKDVFSNQMNDPLWLFNSRHNGSIITGFLPKHHLLLKSSTVKILFRLVYFYTWKIKLAIYFIMTIRVALY